MKPLRIAPSEWEIMTIVWDRSPIAATDIFERIKSKKGWTLTTVRTLLRRLVQKSVLQHKIEGKRYIYTPRVPMDECIRQESESFLDRVLGKVHPSTLLHLVQQTELSKDDLKELRKILREKEKQS